MCFPRIRIGIEGKNENLMTSLKICMHIVCSELMLLKLLPLKRSQLLILLDRYAKFIRSTGINHGMSLSNTEGCCVEGIHSCIT